MKKIKVFVVPSHQTADRTSGVDYVRVLQPMKYLNGYSDGEVTFQVDFYDIHAKKQAGWPEIAKKYDIVYLNYTVLDWQYATMGTFVHGMGKKIIMDLDDAIWFIEKDNVVHDTLKELNGGYILTCILDDVDQVITTNGYLRNVIADKTYKRHDKIHVFPNQIDFELYNKTFPAKDTGEVTILHYGSTSHFEDLISDGFVEGVDRILKEFPNVKVKFVGAFIAKLKNRWGARYENAFGDVDIYKWIQEKFPVFMEEADIVVAPLRDTIYNRCKSDLKFIETASAMKPGVFSRTRPYTETIEDGKTGYIAHSADDWYAALKELVLSKEKREEIGRNAYEYVRKERDAKDQATKWAEVFKKALDRT